MFRSIRKLRAHALSAGVASGLLLSGATAKAEVWLVKKEKAEDWEVSTNGRVDAYLSWINGDTINTGNSGGLVDPANPANTDRYTLVGPQIGIRGNPTPTGAIGSPVTDTHVNNFRIRGGFSSTILAFNIYKQVLPDLKLTIKMALWAGIQNGLNANVRQFNDSASVDFREQYLQLNGSWGEAWGGRRIGLYNRGGMKMNWWLMHQHGVGHPCDVDSSGSATCGYTGTGSMFPARHGQLGYATPDLAGVQLSVAMLDPAMIDGSWNRTTLPRFEGELTYKKVFAKHDDVNDEINAWANGLTQSIGRTAESPPQPAISDPGIAADKVLNVWGAGLGVWGRGAGVGAGATFWIGDGLGTAWALGNTAVDSVGKLRRHKGGLGILNYRNGPFEIAGGYGGVVVDETARDMSPLNPVKISVIKQIQGISGKIAYHLTPIVFSIDGMNLKYVWHRGEIQRVNVISAGVLAEW